MIRSTRRLLLATTCVVAAIPVAVLPPRDDLRLIVALVLIVLGWGWLRPTDHARLLEHFESVGPPLPRTRVDWTRLMSQGVVLGGAWLAFAQRHDDLLLGTALTLVFLGALRLNAPKYPRERICSLCGRGFVAQNRWHIICSPACTQELIDKDKRSSSLPRP